MMAIADASNPVQVSRRMIEAGSKSFAAASRLFDRETRTSAHLLYAWCRHCDDVIDGQDLGFGATGPAGRDPTSALALLRQQSSDALAGKPMREPVFQGLQVVMRSHPIPARHVFELLDGFGMDVDGRTYTTIDDTLSYCYHVAGVVGVMMAIIMGVRDAATLDRASDLGLGFQLTNIARDVIEDALAGRCYVPSLWLEDAALTPTTFAAPANRRALAGVATRLVQTAETYYVSSRQGMTELPLRSGWAVGTARAVYRQIGREVLRRGPDAWTERISTTRAQKIFFAMAGGVVALDARTRGRLVPAGSRAGLWSRP